MDAAQLIEISMGEIVQVLVRNQRRLEKELIDAIVQDAEEGLSHREIARRRGCPKSKVGRVLKKVKGAKNA